jgi:hypothetical protein
LCAFSINRAKKPGFLGGFAGADFLLSAASAFSFAFIHSSSVLPACFARSNSYAIWPFESFLPATSAGSGLGSGFVTGLRAIGTSGIRRCAAVASNE